VWSQRLVSEMLCFLKTEFILVWLLKKNLGKKEGKLKAKDAWLKIFSKINVHLPEIFASDGLMTTVWKDFFFKNSDKILIFTSQYCAKCARLLLWFAFHCLSRLVHNCYTTYTAYQTSSKSLILLIFLKERKKRNLFLNQNFKKKSQNCVCIKFGFYFLSCLCDSKVTSDGFVRKARA